MHFAMCQQQSMHLQQSSGMLMDKPLLVAGLLASLGLAVLIPFAQMDGA